MVGLAGKTFCRTFNMFNIYFKIVKVQAIQVLMEIENTSKFVVTI
jgi:hypothetical protein